MSQQLDAFGLSVRSDLIVGDFAKVDLAPANTCPFDCVGCSGREREERFWDKITSIEGETICADYTEKSWPEGQMDKLTFDFIHDVIARRARYPVEQNIAA